MKKLTIILLWIFSLISAQVGPAKELHRNPPRAWALTNATIHASPEKNNCKWDRSHAQWHDYICWF